MKISNSKGYTFHDMIPYKSYFEYYDEWEVAQKRYIEVHNAIINGGKMIGCDWDFYGVMPPEKEGKSWKIEIECVKKEVI